MPYKDLYTKKITYFEKDLGQIIQLLHKGENVALCSSLATGEERFMDYAAFQMQNDPQLEPLLLNTEIVDFAEIKQKVQMSKKKIVIICPYFYRNVDQYLEFLTKLDQTFPNGDFLTFIKLPVSFWIDPARYSKLSSFIQNILVRQPLTEAEIPEALEIRKQLNQGTPETALAKQIYSLSGGLLKFIKRLVSISEQNTSLKSKELIKNPVFIIILAELAEMYSTLPKDKLHELGITDSKGIVKSELLRDYLTKNGIRGEITLPKKMRALFNLLYENRDHLVSLDQIDTVLHGEYGDTTLWANYKIVNRLKNLLKNKYSIQTVRGKGYILRDDK